MRGHPANNEKESTIGAVSTQTSTCLATKKKPYKMGPLKQSTTKEMSLATLSRISFADRLKTPISGLKPTESLNINLKKI